MNPQHFKDKLLKLLEETESIASIGKDAAQTVELDQARVGRLSRMDAMQAQAMTKETNRRRELTIKGIHRALQRIDDEEYGYCLDCDAEINEKRLEFDPIALYCIECASAREPEN